MRCFFTLFLVILVPASLTSAPKISAAEPLDQTAPGDSCTREAARPKPAGGTFLGGSSTDSISAVATDAFGYIFVVGYTASPGFLDDNPGGGFAAKLDTDGQTVLWSVSIGNVLPLDIAIDDAGRAVIAGYTNAEDLPTSPGAFQPSNAGRLDGFIARLSRDGEAVEWATYLGGEADDFILALELRAGEPVVVGTTLSSEFPVTSGAYDTSFNLEEDAFVAVLDEDGSSLVWSTYLGGTLGNHALDVVINKFGEPIVVGTTEADEFPTTPGAMDTTMAPGNRSNAFVAKLDSGGSSLIFSAYLGGDSDEWHDLNTARFQVAVDDAGNPVVVGLTYSADFPTTPDAYQKLSGGGRDAFVSKIDSTGSKLLYSTYLGGTGWEHAYAVESVGENLIAVAGATNSLDFPLGCPQPSKLLPGDNPDALFVALLDLRRGTAGGTILGGSAQDWGGVADMIVDRGESVIVVGGTRSSDFPIVGNCGGEQCTRPVHAGEWDGLLVKLTLPARVW